MATESSREKAIVTGFRPQRSEAVPETRLPSGVAMPQTATASIPLALSRMAERGEAKAGAPALLLGFGAGMCYAAQVVTVP